MRLPLPLPHCRKIKFLICLLLFLGIRGSSAGEYEYPYTSFSERDPFKPLVNQRGEVQIKDKKGIGDFLLQGIIDHVEGGEAIINNEFYTEGDIVEGYTIKTIEKTRIILEKDGKEYILKWEG